MAIKDLLPLRVRNFVRPAYQRTCKFGRSVQHSVVNSPSWPKPKAWRQLRCSLETVTEPAELYRIANKEFGVFQFEEEIVPFLEYIRSCHPRIVGEIGILFGGNTFLFERTFVEANRLIAVDLKLHNVAKARFLTRRGQHLRMLEGSSYSANMIASVEAWLGADQFDFLFIDGDHSYEGVLRDFLAYYPMVRPGGIIAFHDIVPDEFARTGQRSPENTQDGGGVYLLWRRLRKVFDHREFVRDWGQFGYGIGAIIKPDAAPLSADWVSSLSDRQIAIREPM